MSWNMPIIYSCSGTYIYERRQNCYVFSSQSHVSRLPDPAIFSPFSLLLYPFSLHPSSTLFSYPIFLSHSCICFPFSYDNLLPSHFPLPALPSSSSLSLFPACPQDHLRIRVREDRGVCAAPRSPTKLNITVWGLDTAAGQARSQIPRRLKSLGASVIPLSSGPPPPRPPSRPLTNWELKPARRQRSVP